MKSISLSLLFTICICTLQAKVWYVNQENRCHDLCDGQSWATAFSELQNAIQTANIQDEIWVAQGIYTPHVTDRKVSFTLSKDLKIFGGFNATEAHRNQRNPKKFLTQLSGNIGQTNEYQDNSFTVLLTINLSSYTVIDGFTITGGYANGNNNVEFENGGGWINRASPGEVSSPTISNCIFELNNAVNNGGAFYNDGRTAMCNPIIKQCIFRNNSAKFGGASFNNANFGTASPVFINCQFIHNLADLSLAQKGTGGAIYNFTQNKGVSTPTFANCLFWKNQAYNGGAFYALTDFGESSSTFTNCTFFQNSANIGGAIYLNASTNAVALTRVVNSIFWESNGNFGRHFHFSGNGKPNLTLNATIVDADNCEELSVNPEPIICNHQEVYFNINPQFVDPENGDFHLQEHSPAIDKGNNLAVRLIDINHDFEGDFRTNGVRVDLGMDESFYAESSRLNQPLRDDSIQEGFVSSKLFSPKADAIILPRVSLTLYPNPVQNQFKLHINQPINGEKRYFIIDETGQKKLEGHSNFFNGVSNIYLPNDYPAGIYFLFLEDSNLNSKFVKK